MQKYVRTSTTYTRHCIGVDNAERMRQSIVQYSVSCSPPPFVRYLGSHLLCPRSRPGPCPLVTRVDPSIETDFAVFPTTWTWDLGWKPDATQEEAQPEGTWSPRARGQLHWPVVPRPISRPSLSQVEVRLAGQASGNTEHMWT